MTSEAARPLNPVAASLPATRIVAVLDSGIETLTGAFQTMVNADAIYVKPEADGDPLGHGTCMASLIAADNGGGGAGRSVNGIALSFLGPDLAMIVDFSPATLNANIAKIKRLANYADVINLSFYIKYPDPDMRNLARIVATTHVNRLNASHPGVLLVAGVPNVPLPMSQTSSVFAGLDLPNVLGVVGSRRCNRQELELLSGYAGAPTPKLMAAPGESVPCVSSNGGVVTASGASVAVPQVVSLALFLKWVQPLQSASQIRTFMIDANNSYNVVTAPTGEQYPLLNYYLPFSRKLLLLAPQGQLQNYVREILVGDTEPDLTGRAMATACGGDMRFEVSGRPKIDYLVAERDLLSFRFDLASVRADPVLDATNWGFTVWQSSAGPRVSLSCDDCLFELNRPYDIPAEVHLEYFAEIPSPTPPSINSGIGGAGSVEFTNCQIDQRHPITNTPAWLSVEGTITNGEVDFLGATGDIVTGEFYLPFSVDCGGGLLCTYLETICFGGRELPCQPTLESPGCGNNEGCFVNLASRSVECLPRVGTGANNTPCALQNDCAAGSLCLNGTVCRELCDLTAPQCTSGSCIDIVLGIGTFGVCL